MLRAGVNVVALKEMLGHRSIAMTMRYVLVSQVDLQREYHKARSKMMYPMPKIAAPVSGLPAIQHAIGEASHLIEIFRRGLQDQEAQLKLYRFAKRLTKISVGLTGLGDALK